MVHAMNEERDDDATEPSQAQLLAAQRALDSVERLKAIEAVKEGLASIDRGEGRPMDEVFDDLERGLGSEVRP